MKVILYICSAASLGALAYILFFLPVATPSAAGHVAARLQELSKKDSGDKIEIAALAEEAAAADKQHAALLKRHFNLVAIASGGLLAMAVLLFVAARRIQ